MRGQRQRAGRHRSRPRYGRITAAASALTVTAVAVLGALGVLETAGGPDSAFALADDSQAAMSGPADASERAVRADRAAAQERSDATDHRGAPEQSDASDGKEDLDADDAADLTGSHLGVGAPSRIAERVPSQKLLRRAERQAALKRSTRLPENSGVGRRVVFDTSEQRVWLVEAGDDVRRTYLVSGSVTDNLGPGTYEVYSRSLDAVGIDDSGTMRYMVRFAHGERAAIGFHDIPIHNGEPVQTRDELGTPQSHGCIRQWRPDARALWRFAPVGTKVVVVD